MIAATGNQKVKQIKRKLKVVIVVVLCFILPGCWDEIDLQDVSYISALGIDFRDGKYTLYAQMISFAAVAKTEAPNSDPKQIWVGKGTGDSVLLAIFNLGRTAYTSLNLEHLKTIVVHERAISKIDDVLDGMNRQRASRYTSLLYGTKMPLESLFTTETFFNQSVLNSILYNPKPQERQYTFITPLKMQTAVQKLKEPAMTTYMPVLNFTESYWKFTKDPMKTQIINGVFILKNFKYQGYLVSDDVIGIRWLNENFMRVLLKASAKGSDATVAIVGTNIKHHTSIDNNEAHFQIDLKLTGNVVEHDGEIKVKEIVEVVERKVKEEIESVFKLGIENKMDLLGLEHQLYRYHNGYWKQHAFQKDWMPKLNQLKVNVELLITDTGKYDLSEGT